MLEHSLQELRGFIPTPLANYPHAPPDWSLEAARTMALTEGLILTPEHWHAICALQEYYARNADNGIHGRALHDALDELFHPQGGIKFLYRIFPGGPVAQGCRIAGLKAPFTATDQSFGSVM